MVKNIVLSGWQRPIFGTTFGRAFRGSNAPKPVIQPNEHAIRRGAKRSERHTLGIWP